MSRLDQTREKILNWLSEFSQASRMDGLLDAHMEGTGEWFLSHPSFKDWLACGMTRTLWLIGESKPYYR